MARVTTAEVKEILETSLSDLTPFITAANLLVTAKLGDSSLGESHLKEIERWLAAHFVACRDQRVQSESIGATSVSYQGQTGVALDSTQYGQRVKLLDTTGRLYQLGKRTARITTIKAINIT